MEESKKFSWGEVKDFNEYELKAILKYLIKGQSNVLNIVIAGCSGFGKSSLIKSLGGKDENGNPLKLTKQEIHVQKIHFFIKQNFRAKAKL